MADTTIKTELTLDDLASAILKQISENTEHAAGSAEHAKHSFGSFASEAVTKLHELGINITEVAHKAVEFGESFIETAAAGETADTALGALMSTAQDRSFGEVADDAKRIGDELDEMAAKTGAIGDMDAAFQQLVTWTGATEQGVEKSSDKIYEMAQLSRVLGQDVGGITQQFAMMQEGMLKPKSQLFQLLQSTGLFGDNAKKAAAAWATISEEKRMSILDAALDKVTGKLEKIPPTFANRVQSLHNIIEATKEKIGEPLMEAVMPAVEGVTDKLVELTPYLVGLAKTYGKDIGQWVNDGLMLMKEGFQYLNTHADEIRSALSDVWSDAKQVWSFIRSVVQFIVDHMEGIQALAAIYAGSQGAKLGGSLMSSIADSTGKITAMGVAATAAQLGLSLVAAAAIEAAEKYNKAREGIQESQIKEGQAFDKKVESAQARGDVGELQELGREHMHRQQLGFQLGPEVNMETINRALAGAKQAQAGATQHILSLIRSSAFDISEAHKEAAAGHAKAAAAHAAAIREYDMVSLLGAYNDAVAAHNSAAQAMIESVIMNSKELHAAFDESTIEIEGGMLGMMKAVASIGAMAAGAAEGAAPKMAIGGLTGSGNVTVNMKQDFRQADPDRIAVAFEKSVEKLAARRYQATTSTPFGT